jgi:hypothetical protein
MVAVSEDVWLRSDCEVLDFGRFVARTTKVKQLDGATDWGRSDQIWHSWIAGDEIDNNVVVNRVSREEAMRTERPKSNRTVSVAYH